MWLNLIIDAAADFFPKRQMVREVFYVLELLVQMNCIHTWDGESAMNLLTSIIDAAYYVMC